MCQFLMGEFINDNIIYRLNLCNDNHALYHIIYFFIYVHISDGHMPHALIFENKIFTCYSYYSYSYWKKKKKKIVNYILNISVIYLYILYIFNTKSIIFFNFIYLLQSWVHMSAQSVATFSRAMPTKQLPLLLLLTPPESQVAKRPPALKALARR